MPRPRKLRKNCIVVVVRPMLEAQQNLKGIFGRVAKVVKNEGQLYAIFEGYLPPFEFKGDEDVPDGHTHLREKDKLLVYNNRYVWKEEELEVIG